MRVLLDTCVATSAKRDVRDAGHEVEHVAEWPTDPGDAAILAHAAGREQVVVTLDKDFGERSFEDSGIAELCVSSISQPACRGLPASPSSSVMALRFPKGRS